MRFSTVILALVSAAAVNAAQNFTIMVGMNTTLTYTPSYVNATTGDTLIFEFMAGNHTVSQSTFAMPCANLSTPMTGIDSGFMPVSDTSMPMTFEYTMTNDSTMWFYCRQAGHCQKGMVFAVNPTPEKTFAMFQQAAEASNSTTNTTTTTTSTSPTTSPTTGNGAMGLSSSIVGVIGSVGLASLLL
ncbi:hypothetical protein HYDPIDRAFT_105647 [Hydnomerulius pinastri MD-312]|nr:hypothetical protein HYDPIDRAFT_105647 [Hydnomerulius pinastri MD-312]